VHRIWREVECFRELGCAHCFDDVSKAAVEQWTYRKRWCIVFIGIPRSFHWKSYVDGRFFPSVLLTEWVGPMLEVLVEADILHVSVETYQLHGVESTVLHCSGEGCCMSFGFRIPPSK